MNALLHLLHYGLGWLAIFGEEGLIVAESATTPPFHAIAVRTGESGINGDFLHSCAKLLF